MVYMLLADGFEEMEAVVPLDILRRCGIEIQTVGISGEYVKGSHDIIIKSDISIDEINLDNAEMLILPGGPGRVNIIKSEAAMNAIQACHTNNIPIAAICGAPEILGSLNLLQGKRATCFPGSESKLTGAEIVNQPVVVDGSLITSQAAGTSEAFGFAIAEMLCGKEKTEQIRKAMLCR